MPLEVPSFLVPLLVFGLVRFSETWLEVSEEPSGPSVDLSLGFFPLNKIEMFFFANDKIETL